MDGTDARARAAVTSLEAIHPVLSIDEYVETLAREDKDQEPTDEPPRDDGPSGGAPVVNLSAGDPTFRGERFSNETHRSRTDPDARLFRKGHRTGATHNYLVHNALEFRQI